MYDLDISGLYQAETCIISFPVTEDVYLFDVPANVPSISSIRISNQHLQ